MRSLRRVILVSALMALLNDVTKGYQGGPGGPRAFSVKMYELGLSHAVQMRWPPQELSGASVVADRLIKVLSEGRQHMVATTVLFGSSYEETGCIEFSGRPAAGCRYPSYLVYVLFCLALRMGL